MLCLGNICRSPIAEGVLKKLLKETTLPSFNNHSWQVDSAGIGDWHEGDLPDPRAIRVAKQHGIDISDQRARQIRSEDFDRFDYILVMDEENLKEAKQLAQKSGQHQQIKMLMDYAYPGQKIIVPDPYYTNRFEESYQLIFEGCQAFIKSIVELQN